MPTSPERRSPRVVLADAAGPLRAEPVVVGVLRTPDGVRPAPGSERVDRALGGRLAAALTALGATGRIDDVHVFPTLGLAPFPLVVATGVGDADAGVPEPEQVRRGAGAALRKLAGTPAVTLALGEPAAAVQGALLGSYVFGAYKSAGSAAGPTRLTVLTEAPRDRQLRAAVRRAEAVAAAMTLTRDLVNTPPNDLYPHTFAERAAALASASGLHVQVLDEKALRRGGYGGILAVGAGSARPPRLVRVTYRPARPRARVALVGKGITFDSGGLNLKPGASMAAMKSDMGGAAAALAAVLAAAELKLAVEVTATLPLAENMVSGSSYRPSDVLTLRNGTTLEIADTDAEGRVILADAIVRAVEDEPDYVIETSTLTGGQTVALGTRVIGAMGQDGFRDRVVAAGNAAGEALWPMPLPAELRSGLDSAVADLTNLPSERWGSMLVGGLFLADFVPAGLPWVHLDIAGPSFNTGAPHGYTPKGGTGAAVRTLVAVLEDLAG